MIEKEGLVDESDIDSWALQEVKIINEDLGPEYFDPKFFTFFLGPSYYVVFNYSSRLDGTYDGQFFMDWEINSKLTPEERRAFVQKELP